MEKTISLKWKIFNNKLDIVERYCSNCGKKVEFKDSLKRRQNANGKNIFHFAIYKCPKGHTWNKDLGSFKALTGLENLTEEFTQQESVIQELHFSQLLDLGVEELVIQLEVLQQKERVDRFLSTKINGLSRGHIVDMINQGLVKVNGEEIKSKFILRENDVITLILNHQEKIIS